ncbi:hypothetical protein RFI_19872 [Reticulomyxa filosa]|uniref:Uncharacterized protein n=1 Tax=Reticulomyxa filosa TaxID=46433 RepID=X6MWK0_RETFI|nr:hypothetical protein RFI_19872 [Reticulomyxa filosa]|eukprot:ETO17450.1 hypothetical protein RFI_19872 [Reticulomyxa filosa]
MENQITELIRKDNGCSAHFRYSYQGHKVRVKLVTFNPKHRSTFLVHEIECKTRFEALTDILQYVKDRVRDEEKCYSVTWKMKENGLTPRTSKSSEQMSSIGKTKNNNTTQNKNNEDKDEHETTASDNIISISSQSNSKKGTDEYGLTTSHFYAQDIYQLLEKFFYDKNKDDYIIYKIQLNPNS